MPPYDRFGPPRNSFRDDDRGPRPSAAPHTRSIDVVVKWYNPTKGFGFVTPEGGRPDAFLPGSLVQSAGYDELPDGSRMVVDLGAGKKGDQVVAIHSVELAAAAPRRSPMGSAPRAPRAMSAPEFEGPTETIQGTVKWFNPDKGFGFVAPDSGGKDVFVHVSALQRSGLATVTEGERVSVEVGQGRKGLEAVRLERV